MSKKAFSIYIFLLFLFVPFTFLFVDVNLKYLSTLYTGIYLSSRILVTFLYAFFLVCFYCFYLYFLKRIREKRISLSLLKKLILFSFAILIFAYPAILSYDIFNYLTTAKVIYFYHENPYVVMPNEMHNEPYLLFTRATNKIALYGPSWIILSAIPSVLGVNYFLPTIFLFKLMAGIFYLATSYLIYKISKNVFAVAFFALNPLVLIETMVSGHNDMSMVFFSLLSFYFLSTQKTGHSALTMILSICVKFSTLFLLPVWLYTIWMTIRKKTIHWDKIFLYAGVSMFIIFLLSPIREEMYSWYAVWFIPFAALLQKKLIQILVIAFSFGLMLRYIPFMVLGTYQSPTPEVKIAVTLLPLVVIIAVVFFKYKKRIWEF